MNDSEKKIKELEEANKTLSLENDTLKFELKRLRFQLGINQTILGFHEQNYASAAADLLINPNPVKFHATEAGKGVDYMVNLMDILLIESAGRSKGIYLVKPIRPLEGGVETAKINIDNPKLNFENMLFSLQKNGHHILRVNKKIALNIYHFNLNEKNYFEINIDPPKGFKKSLNKVKTDSKFNHELYHTRLMEIDRLSKHHIDFAVNLKKIEEISRYKK